MAEEPELHEKKLELVEWRDANFTQSPEPGEFEVEADYVIATAGWVEEKKLWLVIVSEITPDGERSVTRVPLENIVRRRRLKIKEPKLSN